MLPRTSITSNHSRLRSERDATAIADSMASETDLSELPTTSVFTYVRLLATCPSLLCREKSTTLAVRVSAEMLGVRPAGSRLPGRPRDRDNSAASPGLPVRRGFLCAESHICRSCIGLEAGRDSAFGGTSDEWIFSFCGPSRSSLEQRQVSFSSSRPDRGARPPATDFG